MEELLIQGNFSSQISLLRCCAVVVFPLTWNEGLRFS